MPDTPRRYTDPVRRKKSLARRFILNRHRDSSGVSGRGIVAEGVQFTDGTVVVRWMTETPSTILYGDIASVVKLHGHAGATEIVWRDRQARNLKGGGR